MPLRILLVSLLNQGPVGIQSVEHQPPTPGSADTRSSILRRINFCLIVAVASAIFSPTDAVRTWSCSKAGFRRGEIPQRSQE